MKRWFAALSLLCLGILVFVLLHASQADFLRFTMFDVGQGDALFVETPDHHQMLIDGGPSNAVLEKLGRSMPWYDRTLDVVALTHPDADHLTGVVEVLRQYRVGQVLVSGGAKNDATYRAFLDVVHERHIPITQVSAGDAIRLSDDVTFFVLAPTVGSDVQHEEVNLTCIVGRLVYRHFSIMFTGDAEAKEEQEVLASDADLKSDVLKVGHHGSRMSTTEAFLSAVHPRIAVISVGAQNRFGHPNAEVIGRLTKLQARVLRTDTDGDIRIESDGEHERIWMGGLGFRFW